MLRHYEVRMRDIIREELGKDVDYMCFHELYSFMESVGLLKKYPNLEVINEVVNSSEISEKSKKIIGLACYDEVFKPEE